MRREDTLHALHLGHFVAPDGVVIAADIGGDPAAPNVIFMHGGGQTRHSWSRAVHALIDAGYHVINYDARGHGDSGWSANGDYSFRVRAQDLRAVIAQLHGPVALVGASMGGVTAMTAITDGLMPAALVMVDIVPRPERRGIKRIHDFMTRHTGGFATLDEAVDAVAAYNPMRPRPKDASGLLRNLRSKHDGRWYWHWDPRILSDNLERDVAEMERTLEGLTHAKGLPMLLIRGLNSDVVTDQSVADLHSYLPELEVFDVSGAGHMVAGDSNDAFNRGIIDFLARCFPATPTVAISKA